MPRRSLPAAGLAHREGAEDLTGRHAGEPLLLLLLRAHVHEVGDGEVVLDAEGSGERPGTCRDHLFVDDRAEAVVLQHPGAAELLGHREADETRLARGEHRRPVDLALGVPALARLVRDVALDELLDDVAERLVVLVVDVALHVRLPLVFERPGSPACAQVRWQAAVSIIPGATLAYRWVCEIGSYGSWHCVP